MYAVLDMNFRATVSASQSIINTGRTVTVGIRYARPGGFHQTTDHLMQNAKKVQCTSREIFLFSQCYWKYSMSGHS